MNMQTVLQSLDIMWKGMVGIFAVIVVIYAAIVIMNRVFRKKD